MAVRIELPLGMMIAIGRDAHAHDSRPNAPVFFFLNPINQTRLPITASKFILVCVFLITVFTPSVDVTRKLDSSNVVAKHKSNCTNTYMI